MYFRKNNLIIIVVSIILLLTINVIYQSKCYIYMYVHIYVYKSPIIFKMIICYRYYYYSNSTTKNLSHTVNKTLDQSHSSVLYNWQYISISPSVRKINKKIVFFHGKCGEVH